MESIRKQLCKYGKLVLQKNLAAGPGGNISARDGDFVYLSPSGFALDEIKESHWVKINLKTGKQYGSLRPSCEISMHLGCYLARPDINAVIHTHPPVTLGLISAGVELKPFYPDFVAILGREIPVVEYVIPAGEEIRQAVVEQIKKYNVVLLKNHGAVCVGATLKEAFSRAWMTEETSKMQAIGMMVGKIRYFTEEEIKGIENLEAEDYRKALLKKLK
ncbi:MAG TPA: class II aldolase/adducin family protein [bacterium]|nr:class II aldolase/adducin family protein [bacterium]HOL35099.1 class II aldolase/adducin family protein [bacterium]HPP08360.1 class II aldolase/adducin family protein [bacterium]